MPKQRELWIDIARGLAIIFVVIDHIPNDPIHIFIHWFHIPAFFIISGYLFRPISDWSDFYAWLRKKVEHFLPPYITYILIITILNYFLALRHNSINVIYVFKYILLLGFGGRYLQGLYGVFWFISCLLITECFFALICLIFKSNSNRLLAIFIAYILAHIESHIIISHNIMIPWDADVTLLALTYFSFGYFSRNLLKSITPLKTLTSISCTILFILCQTAGIINYQLDLKTVLYNHFVLDFFIPITMVITLLNISQMLARFKITKLIVNAGLSSLTIMYMHIPMIVVLSNAILKIRYGYSLLVILCLIIPIAFEHIFSYFPIISFLFLGKPHCCNNKSIDQKPIYWCSPK
jgi:fucose 4-O-acetylase-like acetyltransferase